MKTPQAVDRRERVLLVGVALKRARHKNGLSRENGDGVANRDSLDELRELAESAGAKIEGSLLQVREALDPATLVGRGKLEEIRTEAQFRDVPLVIVDHDLTPVQLRNMEKGTGCRVIDRTQLILDIFATHAHTREGQLQVELAQLNYLLPRLTGRGEELSRLGGGIGTRGPGEQKLETDRRRIRDRVRKIERAIETVRKQRATRRRARQAVPLGMIAFVGYTNAGKSTLFNALTDASVLTSLENVRDSRPHDPRDPPALAAARAFVRYGGISARPAVGFDRGVSRHARRSAGSGADSSRNRHLQSAPRRTRRGGPRRIAPAGVEDRPRLHVLNKIDRLSEQDLKALTDSNGRGADTAFVSAITGAGLDELLKKIDAAMPVDPLLRLRLRLPLADGRSLSVVQGRGRVLRSEVHDGSLELEAEIPESAAQGASGIHFEMKDCN